METKKTKVSYREVTIPAENIKVYINFVSLLKSSPKITKINFFLEEIEIDQLKKISTTLKPSNFTSLINNKFNQGNLKIELETYFNDNNSLENFIARGTVQNFKSELVDGLILDKTNFSFFADKSDILIKNILGKIGPIKISDGDLKFDLSDGLTLKSNFKTSLELNEKKFFQE